jgi:hypothetical protein
VGGRGVTLLVAIGLLVGQVIVPSRAAASGEVTVSLASCDASAHQVVVPSGSDLILIGPRWVAKTRGLVEDFLRAQRAAATLNGQPLAPAGSLYTPPAQVLDAGGRAWATEWRAASGPMALGSTLVVEFDVAIDHPIPDLLVRDGQRPTLLPPGPRIHLLCAITSGTAVGSGGGIASASGGEASVTIPPGALGTDTIVTVAPSSVVPPPTLGISIGRTFEFGPSGTTFTTPVLITLAFDPATLPLGILAEDLRVATDGDGVWQRLPTSIDLIASTVSAQVTHFSHFGVVGTHTLTVDLLGSGSGVVTSTPAGIVCASGTCQADFAPGTSVDLGQLAGAGSAFVSWGGGACSGTGTCGVVINADTTVTARFEHLGITGVSVPNLSQMVVAFGTPMAAGGATDVLDGAHYTLTGGLIIGGGELSPDARSLTLTLTCVTVPCQAFAPLAAYTLEATALVDTDGRFIPSSSFTFSVPLDTTPPTFELIQPGTYTLVLTASEPLDPATVTPANMRWDGAAFPGNITLMGGSGTTCDAAPADRCSRRIRLTFGSNQLPPGGTHTLEVTTGIRDRAGNAATATTFSVTVEGSAREFAVTRAADTTPPTVTSVLSNAVRLFVTYSEDIAADIFGAASVASYSISSDGVTYTPLAASNGSLGGAGRPALYAGSPNTSLDQTGVTFVYDTTLAAGTYYLKVTGVRDAFGNLISPDPSIHAFTVQTATIAPTVAVPNLAQLGLTFTDPMAVGGATDVLDGAHYRIFTGGAASGRVIGGGGISADGRTVTLNLSCVTSPCQKFTPGASHTLEIRGLRDQAGGFYASASIPFTVPADTTAPTFTLTQPGTYTLLLTASEPLDQSTVTAANVRWDGAPFPGNMTLMGGNATTCDTGPADRCARLLRLTFLASALPAPGAHTLGVSGVLDVAGNAVAPGTSIAVTISNDTTAPSVLSVAPVTIVSPNGAGVVEPATYVNINFSEAMARSTDGYAFATADLSSSYVLLNPDGSPATTGGAAGVGSPITLQNPQLKPGGPSGGGAATTTGVINLFRFQGIRARPRLSPMPAAGVAYTLRVAEVLDDATHALGREATPPTITSVSDQAFPASPTQMQHVVNITFSESMARTQDNYDASSSANVASNYVLRNPDGSPATTGGAAGVGPPIGVLSVAFKQGAPSGGGAATITGSINVPRFNGVRARLSLSAPPAAGIAYTLSVGAIRDEAGNTLAPPTAFTLTRAADTTAPFVRSVYSTASQLFVSYSEDVALTSTNAADPASYAISTDGVSFTPLAATNTSLGSAARAALYGAAGFWAITLDDTGVIFTYGAPQGSGTYYLRITGVRDNFGDPLGTTTVTFTIE